MRQYCSGGSRIWSSIQPLPGVCSSGWLRKKHEAAAGRSTRATSAMASSSVVDVLEHQAGHGGIEGSASANGSGAAPART